uniref:hypothetical protein n=1 Tax=Methylacidimicrobium cyclopophantes TaxID=1041766 RepID=UPI001FE3E16D|nr:hypothetical protein [Methylacidimicrobium cyclopophantes]
MGKRGKTRIQADWTRLPAEVWETVGVGWKGEPLVYAEEWDVPKGLDPGEPAVLQEAWELFGLEEILAGVGSEPKERLLQRGREPRVRNPMRLCLSAFWISARIGSEWIAKGFTEEVP